MTRADISREIEHTESIGPGDAIGGGFNGAQIDTVDAGALAVVMSLGGGSADGDYDFALEEAPDDGTGSPGTWSVVASEDVLGSLPTGLQADAGVTGQVGYAGHNRFVRVTVTENTAATTAPDAYAVGLKGELEGFF